MALKWDRTSPRNVTSVGAVVIGPDGLLLVKMSYGSTKGQWMLPGGIVDPGELLDQAVVREVLEETGVTAHVIGICGVRTRHDGPNNDTYVLFLLEHVAGEPESDGHENTDARFLSYDELDAEDVTELSRSMGKKALNGELKTLEFAADFDWERSGRDPRTWRLFR
ncbi:MAG: NUDIX domain-containing protein [Thermomicrobiales bacterium]|nr:NUDIX domain-containing protein [Thermomicrobiales bacterium]